MPAHRVGREVQQDPIRFKNMLAEAENRLEEGGIQRPEIETLLIKTTDLSQELCLSVYKEAIKAGAHPYIYIELPGMKEIFYQFATDTQLKFVNPVYKFMYENFNAKLWIIAPANTRSLSNIDPIRIQTANRAFAEKAKNTRGICLGWRIILKLN